MPAKIWQPADFHNISIGSPDNVLEAIRPAAHVYYYGLLIHHLPYMMHGIKLLSTMNIRWLHLSKLAERYFLDLLRTEIFNPSRHVHDQ